MMEGKSLANFCFIREAYRDAKTMSKNPQKEHSKNSLKVYPSWFGSEENFDFQNFKKLVSIFFTPGKYNIKKNMKEEHEKECANTQSLILYRKMRPCKLAL